MTQEWKNQLLKHKPKYIVVSLFILTNMIQYSNGKPLHTLVRRQSEGNSKSCPKSQFYSENLPGCLPCTTLENCDKEGKDRERCRNACKTDKPTTTKPPTPKMSSKATVATPSVGGKKEENWDKGKTILTIVLVVSLLFLLSAIAYIIYRKVNERQRQTQETPRQRQERPPQRQERPRQEEETPCEEEETPCEEEEISRQEEEISREIPHGPIQEMGPVMVHAEVLSIIGSCSSNSVLTDQEEIKI